MKDNPYSAPKAALLPLAESAKRPLPVTVLCALQFGGGVLALMPLLRGISPEMPSWVMYLAIFVGIGNMISAVALWHLKWFGPTSFVFIWLLPIIVGLIAIGPHSFSQDQWVARLVLMAIYGVVVFSIAAGLRPNNSINFPAPRPLRFTAPYGRCPWEPPQAAGMYPIERFKPNPLRGSA